MKNNVFKTFLLTLLVIVALLGLFFVPRLQIGDTLLRRVNILSDIQQRDSTGRILAEVKADSLEGIVEEQLDLEAVQVEDINYQDSIPDGMTAIEDFASTDGLVREMDKFYRALDEASVRSVRIAYFGDSFIEGDILTADLRNMFQTRYGGNGVGWVDITSISEGFRQTVLHSHGGWAEHNANDGKGKAFNSELQSIAGHYYLPARTGSLSLRGQSRVYGDKLQSADRAIIYFSEGDNLSLTVRLNDGETQTLRGSGTMPDNPEPAYDIVYQPTDSIDEITGETIMTPVRVKKDVPVQTSDAGAEATVEAEELNGPVMKLDMKAHGSGRFYAVSLEGHTGITLDNHSMRGGNGWYLSTVPERTMQRFAQLRPYDLIIIHYGLNVASPKSKDYKYYTDRLAPAVRLLQKCYPQASILIVGVSDRDQRSSDGQLHTMAGICELNSYQRRLASDQHIAFWNLYEAMGGDGSMARMKEEKQANLDYTHINFAGGRHIAQIFFDVLMNGKENYDHRHGK